MDFYGQVVVALYFEWALVQGVGGDLVVVDFVEEEFYAVECHL